MKASSLIQHGRVFPPRGREKKLWQIFLLNTDLIMSHWSVLYPQVEVEEVEVQVVQM